MRLSPLFGSTIALLATVLLSGLTAAEQGDLSATVKAEKAEFRTDERLRFIVTFTNQSKEDLVLPVRDFLGSRTAGKYTPLIRNTATGEKWQFHLLPSRAPVRLLQETVNAGGTLDLTYTLPGTFHKEDGTRSPNLPAGNYELALTIEVNGQTLTPKPAAFTVVAAPAPQPLAKEETAKIIGPARQALAQKLAKQIAAEKDPSNRPYPGAVKWSSLTAEMFVPTVVPHAKGAMVKFSADVPDTQQVVNWSVNVTEQGVDPNFAMHGFGVASKTPPPVAPLAPKF